MTNKVIQTGLGRTTDGELILEPRLIYNTQPLDLDNALHLVDEWDTSRYAMARYTATISNELGQIEVNEFLVFATADTGAVLRYLATLNNISSNTEISLFTAEIVRDIMQLSFQGAAERNIVRIARTLYQI